MRNKYYKRLDEFVELCMKCVDEGMPYIAVILCHELYRHTYPVDPYADVSCSDPVEFITYHIEKLIKLGRDIPSCIYPYQLDLSKYDSESAAGRELEVSTSKLYTSLWKDFDADTLTEESVRLLKNRLPEQVIEEHVVGKSVLDMGCGSGRYSVALSKVGATDVAGIDVSKDSFKEADEWCKNNGIPVTFYEGNVHSLPFGDASFEFVFCNGVLHHTSSIAKGLKELSRVLKPGCKAFLYLYASGGIFWTTRRKLRTIFKRIPLAYTKNVLNMIGMPSNRFIFCDTWYVPVEEHVSGDELYRMLDEACFEYTKITGNNTFDLDGAIAKRLPRAEEMWGEGEHRYILSKGQI